VAHFFGRDAGRHAKLLEARFAMTHAVEADFFVLVARQMQHFHAQQFKRSQEFGATLEQKRCIGTSEFDEDLRPLPIAIVSHGRINRDAIFELQSGMSYHRTEKCIELVCRFDFVHKKLRAISGEQMSNFSFASSQLTAHSYLSFFLALFAAISRISRPRVVRFITACCAIIIKLLSA